MITVRIYLTVLSSRIRTENPIDHLSRLLCFIRLTAKGKNRVEKKTRTDKTPLSSAFVIRIFVLCTERFVYFFSSLASSGYRTGF